MFDIFKKKINIDKLSVVELKENDILVLEFEQQCTNEVYQRIKEQTEKLFGVKVIMIEKGRLKAVVRKY